MYYLFGWSDGRKTIISRGRTSRDVLAHVINDFPRGVTLTEINKLPLDMGKLYDRNHESGWLLRIPHYLKGKI
jgi:hypothetical protein